MSKLKIHLTPDFPLPTQTYCGRDGRAVPIGQPPKYGVTLDMDVMLCRKCKKAYYREVGFVK